MEIKDSKGMYVFKVDTSRRVVTELIDGFFEKEDFARFHDDYVKKVLPLIGNTKPWAIISDLRTYKTSNIAGDIENHVKWKVENNLTKATIVVGNVISKMQMKRAGGSAMDPMPFETLEEADKWLASEGF